jgi:octaprenyl-diphosphate synthase
LQFGELLAVPLTFLIVLTTTHLEDANLVVLAVCHHSGFDSRAGHQGRANLEFSAVADCQNLVDHDLLAYVRSNLFYFDFFASGNAILLATGFYDRVHVDLFNLDPADRLPTDLTLRTDFRRAGYCSTSVRLQQIARLARPGTPVLSIQSTKTNRLTALQATTSGPAAGLSIVEQDMRQVDQVIARRLDSGVPLVGSVSHYIISAGGKRLRPALLLLCCGALGYQGEQRFNMAAVVEFIHTATLLHDDVVDDSALRRGSATANAKFGNPASVLVGDFLYSRAFQMMVDTQSMRIMEVLANATNIIAEGEVMQLMNMHNAGLDEAGYLQVIRSKTAKLFEASARVGAILSGATPAQEDACAEYGQALGTAFQVIDDVLDYTGDAAVMGKNLGDDLREGKTTLPLIAAMQRGSATQRQTIEAAIETGNVEMLDEVIAVVRSTGALDVARKAAQLEAQRAIKATQKLPRGPHTECLVQLASQLLDRNH